MAVTAAPFDIRRVPQRIAVAVIPRAETVIPEGAKRVIRDLNKLRRLPIFRSRIAASGFRDDRCGLSHSDSAAIAAASATGINATTDPSKNSATIAGGFEDAPISVDNPAVSVASMSSAKAKPDTPPIAQCAIR
jgi:hypothetical protein